MALTKLSKNQFRGSAFRLVIARAFILSLLVLSIVLPYVKITYYYGPQTYENFQYYIGLYSIENQAGSQYSANWKLSWFAITGFAFPFVLMYFGLRKRYSFDLGVIIFAVFFCGMTLTPLISPMSMGSGWDLITSEAQIGAYVASAILAAYVIARVFLWRATGGLQVDRIPPPEKIEWSETLKRRIILILAFLSFALPFAVTYQIYRYPNNETHVDTVYYWYGNMVQSILPVSLVFLPIVYLPFIMMWLGMSRGGLFKKGVGLFVVYWAWHLIFFLQPFYSDWSEQITAPTVGIAFFPATLLIYLLAFLFEGGRIERFLFGTKLKSEEGTPKAFFKQCPNCGRDIPLASEECEYCKAKQS